VTNRTSPTTRAVALVAGASAVATSWSGLVLVPAAQASAPAGQDVLNDWGQTVDEVAEEVNLVVDADAGVIAARTRYLHALSSYASLKKTQKVAAAAHVSALRTRTRVDDLRTTRTLAVVNKRVLTAAREVVTSQLAMAHLVDGVTARVRAVHYIQAPYVAPPAAPSGMTAVGATAQVRLDWPAVDGATGYRIYRDGLQLATSVSTSYLDTGLDNGVGYSYAIVATNVAGWSPLSAAVTGTPTVVAPSSPQGLVAAPGDGTVSLAWGATAGTTDYRVYRNGVLVGSPTDPSYVDTGLIDGTSYTYTVAAANGAALSPVSSSVQSTPVALAPSAPTNVAATPGDARVTVSWTAPAGATKYTVYRNNVAIATQAGTTLVDTAVTNNLTYTYDVVAFALNSPASVHSASVTAMPVAPPLSAPVGLSASPGDAKVTLTWGAVTGATSYQVRRGSTVISTTSATTLVDSPLMNNTTYTYTVTALGPSSTSAPSAPVSATPAIPAAGAPTGLTGVAGDKTAALTWNSVPTATGYKVWRDGAVVATTTTTTSFNDTGLTNNQTYSYAITATVSGVDSAKSTAVTVTPYVVTPAAPTALTATGGNAQVSLSWTAAANATGYKVYRGPTLVATQGTTSFVDTGLTNGTAYSYTVVATNGSASSPASAAVSATPLAPPPPAPTGLTATAGNTTVALSWTAVASATMYHVYRNNVLVGSPTGTTYSDTGLTNGTSYTYYVKAVTATTEGTASTSVVATPAKPLVSGTFTGAVTSIAQGHGTIRVVIVLTNSVITSSKGTLVTNDGSETVKINTNAIPQYDTKAVAANSASITKVSGATLTLAAYTSSLSSAITASGR
jgi:fibronectin type 3 domain-containing protein